MTFDSRKFLSGVSVGLGACALTVSAAFGGDALTDAANSATQINDAVATTTGAQTVPCNSLPDAPKPRIHKDDLGSLIHVSTSEGVNFTKENPGSFVPKGGTVGLTIGRTQISQALGKLGIPLDPGTKIVNLNFMISPLVAETADPAGKGAIQQLTEQEAGAPWLPQDVATVNKRVAYLKMDAWTEKATVSAAMVTKSGKLFSCEAGKGPEVVVPSSDPNGTSNPTEIATGGSITATRVGSSYSTTLVHCIEAIPEGKNSKLQVSFLVYKGTIPYVDENDYFGNVISMTPDAFKRNDTGVPNSVRAGALYNKDFGDKDAISINATVGETQGKITYSANGSAVINKQSSHKDTVFAGANESYNPTIDGGDVDGGTANGPTAQKQTGYLVGDALNITSKISVAGVKEWDRGDPDCSTTTSPENCLTNFHRERVVIQYTKNGKGPNHQDRLIVGGGYQKTTSPDGSLTQSAQKGGFIGYVKWSGTFTPFHHKKKQKEGDNDVASPLDQEQPQQQPPQQ